MTLLRDNAHVIQHTLDSLLTEVCLLHIRTVKHFLKTNKNWCPHLPIVLIIWKRSIELSTWEVWLPEAKSLGGSSYNELREPNSTREPLKLVMLPWYPAFHRGEVCTTPQFVVLFFMVARPDSMDKVALRPHYAKITLVDQIVDSLTLEIYKESSLQGISIFMHSKIFLFIGTTSWCTFVLPSFQFLQYFYLDFLTKGFWTGDRCLLWRWQ